MTIPISGAFATAIQQPAQQVTPQFIIYWADSKQLQNMTVTSSSTGIGYGTVPCAAKYMSYLEAINGKIENSFRWGVTEAIDAEGFQITANGNYVAMDSLPNPRYEYSWWASSLTDANGNYGSPEYLDVKYTLSYANYIELWVPSFMGHIKSCTVQYYDSSNVLQSLGNIEVGQYDYLVTIPLPGAPSPILIQGIRLTINSTWFAGDMARVSEFMPVFKEDVSSYVVKYDLNKMREYYNSDVPFGATASNDLQLTLDCTSLRFNRGSGSIVGPYLDRDSKILAYTVQNTSFSTSLGANHTWADYATQTWGAQSALTWAQLGTTGVRQTLETIPLGEFYTDDFNFDTHAMTLDIKARDYTKVLHENSIDKGFLIADSTGAQAIAYCAKIGGVPERKIIVHHAWKDAVQFYNPICWYRFDDSDIPGTCKDTIGTSPATYQGSAETFIGGATTSDASLAVAFGGSSSVSTQPITIYQKHSLIAWVKLSAGGTNGIFTNSTLTVAVVSGKVAVTTSSGTITGGITVNDNNWHLIGIAHGSGFTTITVDGIKDIKAAQIINSIASSNATIGSSLNGAIDEVAVFRTELSVANFYDLWQCGTIQPLRRYPYLFGREKTIWDAMIDIATADLGVFSIDEYGLFNYEPSQLFYEPSFPRFTISQYSLSDSTNICDAKEVAEIQANTINVTVSPIVKSETALQPIWRAPTNESLAITALAGDIGSTDLIIPVTTTNAITGPAKGLPNWNESGFIKIDSEIIQYAPTTAHPSSGIDASNFYVGGISSDPLFPSVAPGRGMFGTVAASHSAGAIVREARRYSMKFTKQPSVQVQFPFITAQIFDNRVDVDLWIFDSFTGDLVISANLNSHNVAGAVIILEGVDAAKHSNYFGVAGVPTGIKEGEQAVYKSLQRFNTVNRRFGLKDITIHNSFIQNQATANAIAEFITKHFGFMVPILTVDTVGIPHLQLGDRVTISNFNQLSLVNIDYWVIQNHMQYDGGLKQQLTLRQVS